jgi:hypothetical protein
MNILEKKELTINKEFVKDVLCNKCGNSMALDNVIGFEASDCVKGGQFGTFFGWGSKYDGSLHRFDLCDKCYDEFIDSFKIPPTIE